MKDNKYILPVMLSAVLGIALIVCILLRTFVPAIILPAMDIPNMVLLSLVALVLDHYAAPNAVRCYYCVILFSVLAFALLPWAAGFVTVMDAVKLGVIGCAVFTVCTFLYTSLQQRLASGPAAKAAPVVSALCLYLAVQCTAGLL